MPSQALFSLSLLICLSAQSAFATPYLLKDHYDSTNFFQEFDCFTGDDPTHGFVNYLSQSAATAANLISAVNSQVRLHVDHTNVAPSGRASVRLTSQKSYTHGLFIADIEHMPSGVCGTWPAFWLFGPNWPNSGEIDIVEGVNDQATNLITLHTAAGCVINNAGSFSDTASIDVDCNSKSGCSVRAADTRGFGTGFNAAGGGVYAMQWESTGVYVWFFPRSAVPGDISSGSPTTTNWGLPVVAFNGGSECEIDRYFENMNIVLDTTFCGGWAGGLWRSSSCGALSESCESYVANNPQAFRESYWLLNSVKVYEKS
jgi:hypothetical protein